MGETTTRGGVNVSGLEEFEAKVRRLPLAVQAELKAANEQNALDFMQRILAIIPIRTGKLVSSLKKINVGLIGVKVELGDTKPYYMNFVEYGHMDRGKHVPPDPFWWPTWRLNKRRFRSRLSRAGNKAIKKVLADGGS